MISLYIVIFLFNLILFLNLNLISSFLNLYDHPNNSRKIHKKKTPILGGFFLILNLIFFWVLDLIFQIYKFDIYPMIAYSILIFSIAIIDDKFDISPYVKFLAIGIAILTLFYFNQDLLINKIFFKFYFVNIDNYFISLFFSWLCLMLFLNSINLYDGINGQAGIYSIFIFLFFFFNNIFSDFVLTFLIPLIFFLIYNLRGKLFLGDNGSFLIGFVISFIIVSNNQSNSILSAETLFLLMFLPGVDMFRLFLERILNKKNPFKPDMYHLHHIILKKFSLKYVHAFNISIYSFLLFIVNYISNIYFIILLLLLYFLLIYKFLGHKTK